MKKLILCIAFLAAFGGSFAQWNNIDSGTIKAIWLLQAGDGWSFSDRFKHWDGSIWTTEIEDTAFHASTCAFPANNEGWVFGYQDSVYRYDGADWTKVYTGFGNIDFCDFYDSNNGWAIGGGITYQYQSGIWTSHNLNLPGFIGVTIPNSISMSSPTEAWASVLSYYSDPARDSSYILKFYGGQWVIDTVLGNVWLSSLCFTDASHGWAKGVLYLNPTTYVNVIYKYDGSSWTPEATLGQALPVPPAEGTIYMFDNNLGWASLSDSGSFKIYVYDGASWTYQSSWGYPIRQFSFTDPQNGWALMSNISHPLTGFDVIYETSTGGAGIETNPAMQRQEICIFPNPASDKISIIGLKDESRQLSIYNTNGKCVVNIMLIKDNEEIDLSSLPSGIYLIDLYGTGNRIQKKIVKE